MGEVDPAFWPSIRRSGGTGRVFLFLQGPHGPFFWRLGQALRRTGAEVLRAGVTAGDRVFWPGHGYVAVTGPVSDWPAALSALIASRQVTDIVLYGDTRPFHAEAVRQGQAAGLRLHVFEEGYLRPYWVTYERGGSNGHSRLMSLGLDEMTAALPAPPEALAETPATWGDMRQHMFWGAVYHGLVLAGRPFYPRHAPHRDISLWREFRLHVRRLLLQPAHAVARRQATRTVLSGGFPYHLVLLQLEHDASFRAHSPFAGQIDFVRTVIDGFAAGAPAHHHLVFKAHPLEDGRSGLLGAIRREARARGLAARVHVLRGGKLAPLLDDAETAVTVNSTAGQQALWRGLPLRAFGRAVYDKAGFVSDQPLARFFAAPARPDVAAYRAYRAFLLQTSQIAGGFYARAGRRKLVRQLVDLMLAEGDPYDRLLAPSAAERQHLLRLVAP